VRDLSYADVGISEHRLGGLDVVVRQFRRTTSGAACAPRSGKARLGALPDQAALELRQCAPLQKGLASEMHGDVKAWQVATGA
jgi:hypothetical protein